MKKPLLTLGLLSTLSLNAQKGLEGIVVEKYYVSNIADSLDADANGASSPLRVGSVTYRIFANLLPGYKVIQMYGDPNHIFKVETTTSFYNDPNFGVSYYGGTSVNNTKKNTQLIDSYFTIGGVAAGMMGVPKSEDTDGSIGNNQGILSNNDPSAGIPITGLGAQDGMMPGTPIALNTLGLTNELNVFDQAKGNLFSTNGGTIVALGGVQGVTSSNSVLLGQFTTDGVFSFQMNIQIGTPVAGGSEIYVASNPIGNELEEPTLTYTSKTNPTLGLDENVPNDDIDVLIFPNPSNGKLNVLVSNSSASGSLDKLEVLSLNGQTLHEQKLISSNGNAVGSVDLSEYEKGIYLVRLHVGDQVINRQIVLN
jgi:hypothetical protein